MIYKPPPPKSNRPIKLRPNYNKIFIPPPPINEMPIMNARQKLELSRKNKLYIYNI